MNDNDLIEIDLETGKELLNYLKNTTRYISPYILNTLITYLSSEQYPVKITKDELVNISSAYASNFLLVENGKLKLKNLKILKLFKSKIGPITFSNFRYGNVITRSPYIIFRAYISYILDDMTKKLSLKPHYSKFKFKTINQYNEFKEEFNLAKANIIGCDEYIPQFEIFMENLNKDLKDEDTIDLTLIPTTLSVTSFLKNYSLYMVKYPKITVDILNFIGNIHPDHEMSLIYAVNSSPIIELVRTKIYKTLDLESKKALLLFPFVSKKWSNIPIFFKKFLQGLAILEVVISGKINKYQQSYVKYHLIEFPELKGLLEEAYDILINILVDSLDNFDSYTINVLFDILKYDASYIQIKKEIKERLLLKTNMSEKLKKIIFNKLLIY